MHTPHPHILLLLDCQILLTSHSGELEGPSNSIGLRLSSGSCFPNWSPWSVLHLSEWWRTLLSSSRPLFKPLYSACFTCYISLEFILIAIFMAMTLVQTPSFPPPTWYTHRKVCLLPVSSTSGQTQLWLCHRHVASLALRIKASSLTCVAGYRCLPPASFAPSFVQLPCVNFLAGLLTCLPMCGFPRMEGHSSIFQLILLHTHINSNVTPRHLSLLFSWLA